MLAARIDGGLVATGPITACTSVGMTPSWGYPTTVPIGCQACGTETEVPLQDLPEVLVEHNERRHDGEDIARVDPELADGIADLAAEDLGLID